MNCLAGCRHTAGTVMTHRTSLLSSTEEHWSFTSWKAHKHTLLFFLLLSKPHSTDNIFILLLVIDIPYFRSALKCSVMCRTHDPQDSWLEFGRNLHVSVFPQAFRGSMKQEEEGLGPAKTEYRLAQNFHLSQPPLFTETGCVLIWVKEKYDLKDLDQSHRTLLLYITLVVHVQSGPRFILHN